MADNDCNGLDTEVPLIEELRAKRPGLAARAAAGNVLAGVRLNCLECSGGSSAEVLRCPSTRCSLYPFRTGKNSLRKKTLTDEQRAAAGERFRTMRANNAATNAAGDDDGDLDDESLVDDDCDDEAGDE